MTRQTSAGPAGKRSRLRSRLLRVIPQDDHLVSAAAHLPLRVVARRLWPYVRPDRPRLLGLLVVLAVGPAIAVAEIALFGRLVDDVLVPADLAALPALAAIYIALNLGSAVASGLDDYLSTSLSQRLLLRLRTRGFAHVLALPLLRHDERRVGDLVTRLTTDASAVERFMITGAASGVTSVLRVIFFTAALFWLQWQLALLAMVVVPLLYWITSRFARLVREASRERVRRGGSVGAIAEEHLGAVPLVQAYGREADAVAAFRRQSEGVAAAELAASRVRAVFTPAVDLAELVTVLAVVALGTWSLASGRLTLGGLLAFLTMLAQLYSPLRSLARLVPSLYGATAGAERVLELLDEPSPADRPGAVELDRAVGHLRLRDLTVRYPGADRPALDAVDLDVAPGELIAVVGPSGAGKSTLLHVLAGAVPPDGGMISLDGHELDDLTNWSLRRNVAVVLQETILLDMTVRANLAYARPDATDDAIVTAARTADAHDFVAALPAGYATGVGPRGRRLSGGQRQRLSIARALLHDAPVLLLDEPTTGLDLATSRRMLRRLADHRRGRTTIMVTHDPVALEIADRVIQLDAGRVLAPDRTEAEAVPA